MPGLGFVEQFFGAKTSPRRFGLARIVIGLVGLLDALVTRRELETMFRAEALRVRQFAWLPDLDPAYADFYIGLWILASVMFIVGRFTKAAGAIVVICITYRLALDLTLYTTNIYLCGLLTLLLVIGDSGAAMSLDRAWTGRPETLISLWPQTLMKLQISIVYLFTAIEKINPGYLPGEVFKRFLSVPDFLDDPWLYQGAAVTTILFELFLAGALWSRRYRGWAFLWGFAFHVSILVLMGFFAAFMAYSAMFVGSYALFLDEQPGSRLISARGRELDWLRRLDWLGVHRFESGPGVLSLKTDRGNLTGWAALRETLRVLPVSFLWASAFDLPLMRGLGKAVYSRAAAERH